MSSQRVGIFGATGVVGQAMLVCLDESSWDDLRLRLFASPVSRGMTLSFRGRDLPVEEMGDGVFENLDLAFFAVGGDFSRTWAPVAKAAGCVVIDNSSAWRGDDRVPLVIPELNGALLAQPRPLVANPNCSTIIGLMAAGPLARTFGLRRMIVSTYQAVSGAGAAGLEELSAAMEAELGGREFTPRVFGDVIHHNLLPWIGEAADEGWTDEELKMRDESRKILNIHDLDVSCTCVRVAVKRAHALSIHVELDEPARRESILEAWRVQPGLEWVADEEAARALNPRSVEGMKEVRCGRLRPAGGDGRQWAFFVVGDQVLKGAAWNAVQIALELSRQNAR